MLYLLSKPVSVWMTFLAFFILGIVAYMNIPVSLLPDIAIPEITVQIAGQNASARELENTAVAPIRQQLLQVGKLRDIRSETRDGIAAVYLHFEYGANTDLAFIEVNEKIDAAMNYLPREFDRPRVIKASATDIPVFNIYLTRPDSVGDNTNNFIELSEFAQSVIRRRFEQLPEVAMIDISGTIDKQVMILPDHRLLEVSGITLSDIENALNSNNIDPGSMTVRDGFYEYVIRFSSVLRTIDDVRDLFIRKNNRIYQLKDLAQVEMSPEKEEGFVTYNGKRAIVLSVIKQSDESMKRMQKAMNETMEQFRKDYPEVEFHIAQNQTELLDYSISNLQQNLILAFLFVFLLSAVFMKDWKSSLIIGLGLFVSLIISLLFFQLLHISLNVVSLTGLILATGNMIDNSIIVTDNIGQYSRRGLPLTEACAQGTREITAPMLSSVLTNISVFFPLIFMSGIAGALFADQAFSVTIGLLVSYIVGIIFIPIVYKSINELRIKQKNPTSPIIPNSSFLILNYSLVVDWVFAHKKLTTAFIIAVFPLCLLLFTIIPKTKMPDVKQSEMLLTIDWNKNIHLQENRIRCDQLSALLDSTAEENAALIGRQQFLLNRSEDLTSQQAQFYVRSKSSAELATLKETIGKYFSETYPQALFSFAPTGTLFERIFSTGEAELTVEYYSINKNRNVEASEIRSIENHIAQLTGERPEGNSFQEQLNLHIDREKLLLYNVPYSTVQQSLRTSFKENRFATLRSQQQYLPVALGDEEKTVSEALEQTLIETSVNPDGSANKMPLSSFVSVTPSKDLKIITAGKAGVYVPFCFRETQNAGKIVAKIQNDVRQNQEWDADFSGSFFANKKMINELIIILLVSIVLMFFILSAQFGNFKQPLIVLMEIPIDVTAALALLLVCGHTLNLMSCIGIVVTCGIIINDSILKVDAMNQLRAEGMTLMDAIHEAGRRRLKAILMTSLTSIVCMLPLLFTGDLGSQLEKPLAIATIGGMLIGTPVSLFVVPLVYWTMHKSD